MTNFCRVSHLICRGGQDKQAGPDSLAISLLGVELWPKLSCVDLRLFINPNCNTLRCSKCGQMGLWACPQCLLHFVFAVQCVLGGWMAHMAQFGGTLMWWWVGHLAKFWPTAGGARWGAPPTISRLGARSPSPPFWHRLRPARWSAWPDSASLGAWPGVDILGAGWNFCLLPVTQSC